MTRVSTLLLVVACVASAALAVSRSVALPLGERFMVVGDVVGDGASAQDAQVCALVGGSSPCNCAGVPGCEWQSSSAGCVKASFDDARVPTPCSATTTTTPRRTPLFTAPQVRLVVDPVAEFPSALVAFASVTPDGTYDLAANLSAVGDNEFVHVWRDAYESSTGVWCVKDGSRCDSLPDHAVTQWQVRPFATLRASDDAADEAFDWLLSVPDAHASLSRHFDSAARPLSALLARKTADVARVRAVDADAATSGSQGIGKMGDESFSSSANLYTLPGAAGVEAATIAGTVVNAGATTKRTTELVFPVADVDVRCFRDETPTWPLGDAVRTDATGAFTFAYMRQKDDAGVASTRSNGIFCSATSRVAGTGGFDELVGKACATEEADASTDGLTIVLGESGTCPGAGKRGVSPRQARSASASATKRQSAPMAHAAIGVRQYASGWSAAAYVDSSQLDGEPTVALYEYDALPQTPSQPARPFPATAWGDDGGAYLSSIDVTLASDRVFVYGIEANDAALLLNFVLLPTSALGRAAELRLDGERDWAQAFFDATTRELTVFSRRPDTMTLNMQRFDDDLAPVNEERVVFNFTDMMQDVPSYVDVRTHQDGGYAVVWHAPRADLFDTQVSWDEWIEGEIEEAPVYLARLDADAQLVAGPVSVAEGLEASFDLMNNVGVVAVVQSAWEDALNQTVSWLQLTYLLVSNQIAIVAEPRHNAWPRPLANAALGERRNFASKHECITNFDRATAPSTKVGQFSSNYYPNDFATPVRRAITAQSPPDDARHAETGELYGDSPSV